MRQNLQKNSNLFKHQIAMTKYKEKKNRKKKKKCANGMVHIYRG
jgi:hypothetical protein